MGELQLIECWLACPGSIRLNSISWDAVQPGSYASRKPSFALLGRSWGWTNGTPGGHPISMRMLPHGLSTACMWPSHSLRLQNRSLIPFLSAISWTRSLRTLWASSRSLLEGGRGLHLVLLFLLFNNGLIDPAPAIHSSNVLLGLCYQGPKYTRWNITALKDCLLEFHTFCRHFLLEKKKNESLTMSTEAWEKQLKSRKKYYSLGRSSFLSNRVDNQLITSEVVLMHVSIIFFFFF